jgi:hypothetical protein
VTFVHQCAYGNRAASLTISTVSPASFLVVERSVHERLCQYGAEVLHFLVKIRVSEQHVSAAIAIKLTQTMNCIAFCGMASLGVEQ